MISEEDLARKLEEVNELLDKKIVQTVFKHDTNHLMRQVLGKLEQVQQVQQEQTRKRSHSSLEEGYNSSYENAKLPGATLTGKTPNPFKKSKNGGKTRKNRSRRNRNRKH